MLLIVGLGNIGEKYENTRHNIGFRCVDELHRQWKTSAWKTEKKFSALISETEKNNKKILLAKPATYMNNSGEAVSKIAKYYKIPLENILVVYDDLDLDCGGVRIRKKGGSGTHNGMKSLLAYLGSEEFSRIRIGIGMKPDEQDAADYVLGKWPKKDEKVIEKTCKDFIKIAETIVQDGIETAMNQWNREKSS